MTARQIALEAMKSILPPKKQTLSEWADENAWLSSEDSTAKRRWETDQVPYQRGIMDAFTDPKVRLITMMTSAQIGKSAILNNILGYIVSEDPGPTLFIQPSVEVAQRYSKERIAPMIRNTPVLREKISEAKTRDSGNTIMSKSFPGGDLVFTGANSAAGLASKPVRYLLMDEIDRYGDSAGTEGDPIKLGEARTQNFDNRKIIATSTPVLQETSKIYERFIAGTQEEWQIPCPACGEYHYLIFDDLTYITVESGDARRKSRTSRDAMWKCPACGALSTKQQMMRASKAGKWVAKNEDAYQRGHRSFRVNVFSKPWGTWEETIDEYLEAEGNNVKMQVVFNTKFGEPWILPETQGDVGLLMSRCEEYAHLPHEQLPDGVLAITCGVDTQPNRLEYEIVGWGRNYESWGLGYGVILGSPEGDAVWQQLDGIVERRYNAATGKSLRVSLTFVDMGGLNSGSVYKATKARKNMGVYAIKGVSGDDIPYVRRGNKEGQVLLLIGVDQGKQLVMSSLDVEKPGERYSHFPTNPELRYDEEYFKQLLSERTVVRQVRGKTKIVWEKVSTHARNEALDCRNYARAAADALNPNWDQLEARLHDGGARKTAKAPPKQARVISAGVRA